MKPYEIVGELKRFDKRNSAFARRRSDPESAVYGIDRNWPEKVPSGKTGYEQKDFALKSGAWAIARQARRGEQTETTPEEMDYAERADTGPYEPDDWCEFTKHLKRAARFYGAVLVGVTRVNPLWLYACDGEEALGEGLDTAVVMAVEMDYDLISTSPAVAASAAAGNGYSKMAFTAPCLARYLTDLGWQAVASGNDIALSIPLALDAGLGELGRNGLLITAKYGPRVRLCKVFTDAPLVVDEPVTFGVREFCDVCMKCADTCPSKSISYGEMTGSGPTPSNNPGALKWYISPDKCLAFWQANGTSCVNCIRSCPFNKRLGWTHDLVRWFIKARSHPVDRFTVLMDSLCGYGKQKDPGRILKE